MELNPVATDIKLVGTTGILISFICWCGMYEQDYNWVVFGNKIREIIERIS